MPYRFRNVTLESSPLNTSAPGLTANLRIGLSEESASSASFYLWGDYGVGKTGLAVGYGRAFFEARYTPPYLNWGIPTRRTIVVSFWTIPSLLSQLRASYAGDGPSEWHTLEECRNAELLILDDLGAEHIKGTGWVEDRLYQVIGYRHEEALATVFTSNLDLDALSERLGVRITWRIVELCGAERIIRVEGPNLRERSQP